jgi:hypothetical protein
VFPATSTEGIAYRTTTIEFGVFLIVKHLHRGQLTMALRVQAANRPILDAQGFFHGAIVAVKPVPSTDKYKAPRYRWTIEGPGTVRSMGFHFTTPSELADVLNEAELESLEDSTEDDAGEVDASPAGSVLAQVCLALELVSRMDLDPHLISKTIDKLDLEQALGLAVKCRLAKRTMTVVEKGVERKTPYIAPILETLALDQ